MLAYPLIHAANARVNTVCQAVLKVLCYRGEQDLQSPCPRELTNKRDDRSKRSQMRVSAVNSATGMR